MLVESYATETFRELERRSKPNCGNCGKWMTKSCPKETRTMSGHSKGPNCNGIACKDYVDSWTVTDYKKAITLKHLRGDTKQLMRLRDLIEAPLADYKPIGDFTKPGSFTTTKYDPKLATNPVNIGKAKQFFGNSEFDFRLYPVNKRGLRKYTERGQITREELTNILPETAELDLDNDSINVFYVSNVGEAKVPFTPWIMAHRIGHAIQASRDNYIWTEYEKHVISQLNHLLNQREREANLETLKLINAMGTMRSARTNKIKRPYEFLYEMFAQYINSGKVTLNAVPGILDQEYADMLADDFGYYIDSVLGNALNKIFLM